MMLSHSLVVNLQKLSCLGFTLDVYAVPERECVLKWERIVKRMLLRGGKAAYSNKSAPAFNKNGANLAPKPSPIFFRVNLYLKKA